MRITQELVTEFKNKTEARLPDHIRFLAPGENWMKISSQISIGISGYHTPLPNHPFTSITTGHPGHLCMIGPELVSEGFYDLGITTPTWYVSSNLNGKGPCNISSDLAAIAVFPHNDYFGMAVRSDLGISSLYDIRDKKIPLRISTCPIGEGHPGGWILEKVLNAIGITLEDIIGWGGEVRTDLRMETLFDEVREGNINAIFDESVGSFLPIADELKFTFLDIPDEIMAVIKEISGAYEGVLNGEEFGIPNLKVKTIDFKGWLLYCRQNMADEVVYLVAKTIDDRQAIINRLFMKDPTRPRTGMSNINMKEICKNTHLKLHPGAEKYYREKGYL